MTDRTGIFAGDNPFVIAQSWLAEAERSEPNDPNAIALSTVDATGMPNVRMVLLKQADEAGVAPPVFLASTHLRALDFVTLERLRACAIAP